jgi:hypothetical protein
MGIMANFTKENIEKMMKEKQQQAKDKPNKLIKISPGWYLVFVNGEMVEINQYDEGPNKNQWIAREYNYKWYSDPMPTLKSIKISLELKTK